MHDEELYNSKGLITCGKFTQTCCSKFCTNVMQVHINPVPATPATVEELMLPQRSRAACHFQNMSVPIARFVCTEMVLHAAASMTGWTFLQRTCCYVIESCDFASVGSHRTARVKCRIQSKCLFADTRRCRGWSVKSMLDLTQRPSAQAVITTQVS